MISNCQIISHHYKLFFSEAGSDGNFDSYLQGLPKSGGFEIVNMVLVSFIIILILTGFSIYTYMRIYLNKKFDKVYSL